MQECIATVIGLSIDIKAGVCKVIDQGQQLALRTSFTDFINQPLSNSDLFPWLLLLGNDRLGVGRGGKEENKRVFRKGRETD